MSIPGSAHPLLATILEESDLITKSLRFDSDRETELTGTPTGLYEGNSQIWTWSAWVKRNRSAGSSEQPLFGNQQGDKVGFLATGKLHIFLDGPAGASTGDASLTTAYKFLDYSAWYHIVIAVNTTQANSSDRIKVYVNGIRQYTFDSATDPAFRRPTNFNSGWTFYIGRQRVSNVDTFFDGHMADVHFIDGQEYNQYDFGKFVDALWQPKAFSGSAGYFAADIPGTSSPYVYQSIPGTYGNLSSLTTDGGVYAASDNRGGFLRLGFDTPYTGVTNVKFKGGGYAVNSSYILLINGVTVGSARSTISSWGEESINIPSTDISSIEVRSVFNGYALGSVKFNDTLITGTPSLGTPARGQGSFRLDFEDNSSVAALGTDDSGNGNNFQVENFINNVSPGGTITAPQGSLAVSAIATTGTWEGSDGPVAAAMIDGNSGNSPGTYYNARDGGILFATPITGHFKIKHARGAGGNCWNLFYDSSNNLIYQSPNRNFAAGEVFTMGPYYVENVAKIIAYSDATGVGSDGHGIRAFYINDGIVVYNTADPTTFSYQGSNLTDSFVDSPSNGTQADTGVGGEVRGNYATLNPLDAASGYTFNAGNLDYTNGTSGHQMVNSTISVNSGKWYVEVTPTTVGGTYMQIGITPVGTALLTYTGDNGYAYLHNGQTQSSTGTSTYGSGYTANDVIGIAFDADAGNLYFYLNGVVQNGGTAAFTSIDTSKFWRFSVSHYDGGAGFVNFGQHPFAYTAPTGFKALCTANLPASTIADGTTAMAVRAYSGNAATGRSISGFEFSPDWVWLKNRTSGNRHHLYDTVRGETNALATNYSTGETVETNGLTQFEADGFQLGSGSDVNATGNNYIAWCWDAGANSSKTYAVTVVSDGGNKYRFDGHNTSAVTLDLEEGSTYTFDQSDSSNAGHPLRFSTTSDGTHGSGSEYTTGVVTNGTPGSAGAYTRITIAAGAPTLYYYCSVHSGMGGQIDTNSTAGATVLSGSLNSSVYDQSQNWTSLLTSSAGTISSASNSFDGSTSTTSQLPGTSTGSYIQFGVTLNNVTKLEIYQRANSDISGAGIQTYNNAPAAQWVELTLTSSTVSNIRLEKNNNDPGIYAIRVNGVLLVDSGVSVTNIPSISSTVRSNPATGFAIVEFTASYNQPDIIAHNLNAKPDFIVIKDLGTSTRDWWTWHSALTDLYNADNFTLKLNATASTIGLGTQGEWDPTTTTFSVNTTASSSHRHIAYCFTAIEGYSAFGRYRGVGLFNQTFIYTGFKPQWLMIKRMDGGLANWVIFDRERNPLNTEGNYLRPNVANGETVLNGGVSFKSNGFHIDGTTHNETSENAGEYLYIAFAEHPFASNCQAL